MFGTWCLDLRTSLWSPKNGFIELNMELMEVLKNIRPGLLHMVPLKKKEWTMMRYLCQLLDIPLFDLSLLSLLTKDGAYNQTDMKTAFLHGSLKEEVLGVQRTRLKDTCMQVEESPLWVETSP